MFYKGADQNHMKIRKISFSILLSAALLLSSALYAAADEASSAQPGNTGVNPADFPVYNLSATGSGSYNEMQAVDRIIDQAYNPDIYVNTKNDCARWVFQVYTAAGVHCPYRSGADLWAALGSGYNMSMTDIPAGAIVIGTGRDSNVMYEDYYFGHVGICLGDINSDGVLDVRDCTGPGPEGIHTSDINTWVSWQTDNIFGDGYQQPGFVGWVFPLQ